MSEMNERQQQLCDTIDGFVVVDAGPGTGKTHSIVQRYVNILNGIVDPMKVLMLTFTRNAAEEMEGRISAKMSRMISEGKDTKGYLANAIKNLKVSTIDSFCLDVVLNSPEKVGEFFDPDDDDLMLSRSAALVENETLNRQYFSEFYSRFIRDNGRRYKVNGIDYAAIVGDKHMDVYKIICKLMSRGIIPKKRGWFGLAKDILIGDRDAVLEALRNNASSVMSGYNDLKKDKNCPLPELVDGKITDELLEEAAMEDREGLIALIHDVYHSYIVQCIRDNRLTFGLCELFAFIILLKDGNSRNLHSVDYLTIDEFQDTNELQMKICLLLLNKPNMCVVGDWKQGIFGFRYVSIDNIVHFEERINSFIQELKDSGVKFQFESQSPKSIEFEDNYRSSKKILDVGFQSLDIKGNKNEEIKNGNVVRLNSVNDDILDGHTEFRCVRGEDIDDEISKAVDLITEYRYSGRYQVVERDGDRTVTRDLGFGDIAVLCRSGVNCIKVFNECKRRGIPAYLQGDLEVMNSEAGKLVLAWLRYVNNPKDARGLTAIMADMGYPLSAIHDATDKDIRAVPDEIEKNLYMLRSKRRRLNDLITSIFDICNLNDNVVQTIINILSSAHENSLMTISDLIRLIEDDIKASTKYNVEPILDDKAVTIQTDHKSKGLEYPAVIVVGLNSRSFPSTRTDDSSLIFNDTIGLRCTMAYVSNDDDGTVHQMAVKSWRTAIVKKAFPKDYSEERRLLFVAMTRAKQYLAVTASNPSRFYEHFAENYPEIEPEACEPGCDDQAEKIDAPAISEYQRKRMSINAHDLMDTLAGPDGLERKEGKGKEYGEKVHQEAYLYLRRGIFDDTYPEMKYIVKMINDLRGAKLHGEIKCVLPVDDVSIKGTIDLLAEYDDHIEIHDYKTDEDESYLNHYRLQLSIYALAAESMGKEVRCFVDFVSMGRSVPVEPYDIGYVKERIAAYKTKMDEALKLNDKKS